MKNPLGISINKLNTPLLNDYAAAGIPVAELFLSASIAPPQAPEALIAYGNDMAKRIAQAGMILRSVHLPFSIDLWNPSNPDEEVRRAATQGQARMIQASAEWGAPFVVLHVSCGPVPDEERPVREAYCNQNLRVLAHVAEDCGVRILAENLPNQSLVNASAPLRRVTEDGKLAGICMDVNHLFLETHAEFIERIGPLIQGTHFSDYDGIAEQHWLPGLGIVPWKQVLDGLEAMGYDGPYLFEVRPDSQGHPYTPERLAGCLRAYLD